MRDVSAAVRPDPTRHPRASTTIALVVIENDRLKREMLCDVLRRQPEFRVIASGPSVTTVEQLSAEVAPTVLLLAAGAPATELEQSCLGARARFPAMRVMVTDIVAHESNLVGLIRAGVTGFVRKHATNDELAGAIRDVAVGASTLPRALTASLFHEIVRERGTLPEHVLAEGTPLTAREREIVALLGEGLSNKEIAARLHIAIHTVKSHVHHVLEKLALHTRLEIVAYARPAKDDE